MTRSPMRALITCGPIASTMPTPPCPTIVACPVGVPGIRTDRLDDANAAVSDYRRLSRRRSRDQDLVDAGVAGLCGFDSQKDLVAAQRARRHVDDTRQIGAVVFDEGLELASSLRIGENRRRLSLRGDAVGEKCGASSNRRGTCCFENPTTRNARRRRWHPLPPPASRCPSGCRGFWHVAAHRAMPGVSGSVNAREVSGSES